MKRLIKIILPNWAQTQILRAILFLKVNKSIFYHFVWFLSNKKLSRQKSIFIVGPGHSGTSILHSVLNHHPNLFGIPNETYWFAKALNAECKKEILSIINLQRLFYFEAILEKTPSHLFSYTDICSAFPRAKFIVMVRDPRDIVASYMSRGISFDRSIKKWLRSARKISEISINSNVKIVKLEELTKNPEEALASILNFCELTYYPLHQMQGKVLKLFYSKNLVSGSLANDEIGHRENRNWQINQPLMRNTSRWRKELTEEQVQKIAVTAKSAACEFGYSL